MDSWYIWVYVTIAAELIYFIFVVYRYTGRHGRRRLQSRRFQSLVALYSYRSI